MSGKRPSHTFEKRLLRRDGSSFWVSVTLTRAQDGSFGISLIDDLTGRKELEDELRQAQKMEAVGKLAGGIAHDFNNVMTAVIGCAELLLNEIGDDDPRRERVEIDPRVGRARDQAHAPAARVLTAPGAQARARRLSKVAAGLEAMLERLLPAEHLRLVRPRADAIAQVDLPAARAGAAQPRPERPRCDAGRRQHHGVGAHRGRRTPSSSCRRRRRRHERGDAEPRSSSRSSRRRRAGTGLGLSTVDGIVAQSGGTIAVESEPGEGSTFTIRLPRVYESPVVGATRFSETADGGAGQDPARRRRGSRPPRHGGAHAPQPATTSSRQRAAKKPCALLDDGFDALVTDVAMTGMNGQALARHVRERFPSMPVLFISGYPAEVLTGQHMVDAGEEVLTKPFTPLELTARLELVRQRAATLTAA